MGTINNTTPKINNSVLRGEHDTSSWDDIIIPPSGLARNNLAPDRVVLTGGIEVSAFSGTSVEQLSGSFEIPHDYKEGTDLRPHIHWCPSNSSSGNVKWQFEYTIANTGDSFPSSTIITAIDDTDSTDRMLHAVEFDVIAGSTYEIGTICHFRLFRDGADAEDTYLSDAFLSSIGVHYEQNSDGSRQIFSKE